MTYPYPGFATDLQQPLTALLLMTTGTSEIIDTIYAKRVNHVPELARMGADITVEGNMIIVNGQINFTAQKSWLLIFGQVLV